MKKQTIVAVLLSSLLAGGGVLTLAGCGGTVETTSPVSGEVAGSSTASVLHLENNPILEALVQSPEMQKELEEVRSSLDGNVFQNTDLAVQGNQLIYRFTLQPTYTGEVADAMRPILLQLLSSKDFVQTFADQALELQENLGVNPMVITVEILESDGTVLLAKEYTPTSGVEGSATGENTINENGTYNTVQDFIRSDIASTMQQSLNDTMASAGLQFSMEEQNGNLLLIYQFQEQQSLTDDQKAEFASQMEAQLPAMAGDVAVFQDAILTHPNILVQVKNADGTLLFDGEMNGTTGYGDTGVWHYNPEE